MTLKDFIKNNRAAIDATIKRQTSDTRINNNERRLWILNDENLYNWARRQGVKI